MDSILNALKCVNCRETLSMPVLLPCGHMICQRHTQVSETQIVCSECGVHHANKEFTVARALLQMIQAKLPSVDFGRQHTQTSKSCDKLKNSIDKNDMIFRELDFHIHEKISFLKNRIMLKSEEYKVQIGEISRELVGDLEEYEKECLYSLTGNANGQTETNLVSLMEESMKQNEMVKKKWNEWSRVLNELKVDEEKWRKIQEESDQTLFEMSEQLKKFERELFINKLNANENIVEFFENANLISSLKVIIH